MKLKWMAQTALCVVAASSLAGCVTPVQVKNVEQDKTGYLTHNFSPDDLPESVQKTISDADSGQLNFKKVTYHVAWSMNVDDKNKTTSVDETRTLTNVGGSLVESMAESSRNGEPIAQNYDLSYRNLLPLKTQTMNVSANLAPMRFEVKEFEHFDPISSLKSGLDYRYKTGTSVQIMNYRDGRTSCARGDAQPASDLSPSLSGEAWDIICTSYNMNGVQQNKERYTYFMEYGFAIRLHSETAAGINDAKLISIAVQ
jgi:archaellum component FlaF (FlaF/FlaG flagellin family)